MARGINKVILIGNLGKDPDSKSLPSGSSVTNLALATDESYKDKQSGEMISRTEWHRISMFGRLAEIAAQYLKKGSKVYIEGRLQTRKWQDQSGQDRYSTDIVANEMQMLDSKGDDSGSGSQEWSGSNGNGGDGGNNNQGGGGNNNQNGNRGDGNSSQGGGGNSNQGNSGAANNKGGYSGGKGNNQPNAGNNNNNSNGPSGADDFDDDIPF